MFKKQIQKNARNTVFMERGYHPRTQFIGMTQQYGSVINGQLKVTKAGEPLVRYKSDHLTLNGPSTNLLTRSAMMDDWGSSGLLTTSASSEINPTGQSGCTEIRAAQGGSMAWLYRFQPVASTIDEDKPLVYSVYVKKPLDAKSSFVSLLIANDGPITTQSYVRFSLEGEVARADTSMTRATNSNDVPIAGGHGFDYVGDGWFRLWVWALFRKSSTYTRLHKVLLYPCFDMSAQVGDGSLVWGAQYEQGTSPTPVKINEGSQQSSVAQSGQQPISLANGTVFVNCIVPGIDSRLDHKSIIGIKSGNDLFWVSADKDSIAINKNSNPVTRVSISRDRDDDRLFFALSVQSDGVRVVTDTVASLPIALPVNFEKFNTLTLGAGADVEWGQIHFNRLTHFPNHNVSIGDVATYKELLLTRNTNGN